MFRKRPIKRLRNEQDTRLLFDNTTLTLLALGLYVSLQHYGGRFQSPAVTPLSLKIHQPNFAQR